jgi:hypothetical protein
MPADSSGITLHLSARRRRRLEPSLVIAALLCLPAVAACGDDDEAETSARTSTVPAPTTTAISPPAATAPRRRPPRTGPVTAAPEVSPEERPGGAGDEEPIHTEANFVARGRRITPTVVSVPPFIAVRVVLRSADRRTHTLRFRRHLLRVSGRRPQASVLLGGLRQGDSYTGRPAGRENKVTVVASAEPGP